MKRFTLLKSFLLLCALIVGAGTAWADETPELTLDLTSSWGKGTTTSDVTSFTKTIDGANYTISGAGGANFKFSSSYFIFGKKDAYINLPKVDYEVEKIVVIGNAAGSSAVKMNMFVGATAVSTETTGCGTGETTGTASTLTYEIASSSQAANTQYTLKITSSHNAQITYIKYYKKTSGGGSTPSVSLNNTSLNPTCAEGDGTINVTYNNIASVDAEVKFYESDGMTAATYDWFDAEINSNNNVYYTYSANSGAARTAYMKVHEKNEDVYSELITITQAQYTVPAPVFSLEGGSYLAGSTFTITSEGNTIYYTTDGSAPTASSTEYTGPVVILEGKKTYKAIAVDANNISSSVVTRTITGITPVALPFSWAKGTTRATINSMTGVLQTGLDSDYNDDDYKLKFNGDNDNIIIFTNARPAKVSIGVKMIGGGKTSKFSILESTNGAEFTEVEQLTISGAQNDVVNLETTSEFAATTRVIKLNFIKGDNVGLGPLSISAAPVSATVTDAGWATWVAPLDVEVPSEVEAYAVSLNGTHTDLTALTAIPAGTPVLLKNEGTYQFPVATETPAAVSTALLVSDGTEVANAYVLAKPEGKEVGFYKWIGTSDSPAIPAGKVYLIYAASTAPDFIGFGDATGISSIENGQVTIDNSEVYNLAGQRVAQPTKGLYIINGKKYVVK